MYVRDELGGFPGCACSLLLSVSLFSPIGGGDQRVLVTAFSLFGISMEGGDKLKESYITVLSFFRDIQLCRWFHYLYYS